MAYNRKIINGYCMKVQNKNVNKLSSVSYIRNVIDVS